MQIRIYARKEFLDYRHETRHRKPGMHFLSRTINIQIWPGYSVRTAITVPRPFVPKFNENIFKVVITLPV